MTHLPQTIFVTPKTPNYPYIVTHLHSLRPKSPLKNCREYDVALLGTSDSNVAPCERHFAKRKNIKIKEKNCTIHRLHGGGRLVLSCPENKASRMETSDLLAIL